MCGVYYLLLHDGSPSYILLNYRENRPAAAAEAFFGLLRRFCCRIASASLQATTEDTADTFPFFGRFLGEDYQFARFEGPERTARVRRASFLFTSSHGARPIPIESGMEMDDLCANRSTFAFIECVSFVKNYELDLYFKSCVGLSTYCTLSKLSHQQCI